MLAPGTTIEGYRVDRVVGQGGMGVVYEATQLSLRRTIALKLLVAELSEDPSFRERFRREGLLQAGLDHPHIVPVYEAGESPYGLFLAMRLVRGPDLKRMLRQGPLDAGRAVRILGQVADALDSAHEAGLTHRDIKPQNVLVAARDHAYLADFGLTKATGARSLTHTGQFVGTVNYTAPEQIRGEGAGWASDVYGLGAVLYECLCGEVPFPRDSEAAVIYAHLQEPPPRPTSVRADLPPDIDDVVAQALSKLPGDRQGSAAELLADAGEALGIEEIPPTRAAEAKSTARRADAGGQRHDGTPSAATQALKDRSARRGRADEGAPAEAGTVPGRASGERVLPARTAATLAAALAVAMMAATFLLGRAGGSGDDTPERRAPQGTRVLRSSRVALAVPRRWREAPRARVPGLPLAGRVAAAPLAPAGAALIAGRADAQNETLLPGTLLARLPQPPRRPARVALGALPALRYDGLRPNGLNGTATIYAVPSTSRVATIACVTPPGGSAAWLAACGRAATSLRLLSGRPFTLSPRGIYARQLRRTVRTLNRIRERSRDRLRFAPDSTFQAQAAEDLAGAYKAARRTLAPLRVSPAEAAAHDALLRALGGARGAYLRLAAAARSLAASAYRSASREVTRTEGLVASALRGLRPLGYRAT